MIIKKILNMRIKTNNNSKKNAIKLNEIADEVLSIHKTNNQIIYLFQIIYYLYLWQQSKLKIWWTDFYLYFL